MLANTNARNTSIGYRYEKQIISNINLHIFGAEAWLTCNEISMSFYLFLRYNGAVRCEWSCVSDPG